MRLKRPVLLLAAFLLTQTALAQKDSVNVTMATGNLREAIAYRQVIRLISEYTLYKWLFTRDIHIDESATPHSHPVLTLNTSYLNDDEKQLATFLHQQIRWYLVENQKQVDIAIREWVKRPDQLIPDITKSIPNDTSSWKDLLSCTLERDGLVNVLGRVETDTLMAWREKTSPLATFYQASIEHSEAIHRQMLRFRLGLPPR